MAEFPLDPQLAKMVVASPQFRLLPPFLFGRRYPGLHPSLTTLQIPMSGTPPVWLTFVTVISLSMYVRSFTPVCLGTERVMLVLLALLIKVGIDTVYLLSLCVQEQERMPAC